MAVLHALCLTLALAAPAADEEGFTPLFDGKTLEGWEGDERTFRVEDGVIVAGSLTERIPRNEFLCTTREYGDFELRLEAKLTGQGDNAGVQFRSKRVPDHHEVSGFQCDLGRTPERPIWGSLYDESRRRRFLAQGDAEKVRDALKPDDWNTIIIRAEGDRIRIRINALQTVDYTETEPDIPVSGVIGLQIHGGLPSEARYRNIRIKELE